MNSPFPGFPSPAFPLWFPYFPATHSRHTAARDLEYAKLVEEQKQYLEAETKRKENTFQAEPKLTLLARLTDKFEPPRDDKKAPTQVTKEDIELHFVLVHLCEHEAVGRAFLKNAPEGTLAPDHAHISQLLIPLSVGPMIPARRSKSSNPDVKKHGATIRTTDNVSKEDLRAIRKHRQEEDPDTTYITDDADEEEESLADAGPVRQYIQKAVRAARNKYRREHPECALADPAKPEIVKPMSVRVRIWTVEVVFHPSIIKRMMTDLDSKLAVIDLALLHIGEDHGVYLERPYCTLDKVPQIGTKMVHYSKEAQEELKQPLTDKIVQEMTEAFLGTTSGTKTEIKITSNKSPEDDAGLLREGLRLPSGGKLETSNESSSSPELKQVGGSQPLPSKTEPREASSSKPLVQVLRKQPSFVMSVKNQTVTIIIDISEEPGGSSAIAVDISETHWKLFSPTYEANVPFPKPIRMDDASAKFSKKKGTLTITAPFK